MFAYNVEIPLEVHAAWNMIWILIYKILNSHQLLRAYCLGLQNKYYSNMGCCSHTSAALKRFKLKIWKFFLQILFQFAWNVNKIKDLWMHEYYSHQSNAIISRFRVDGEEKWLANYKLMYSKLMMKHIWMQLNKFRYLCDTLVSLIHCCPDLSIIKLFWWYLCNLFTSICNDFLL